MERLTMDEARDGVVACLNDRGWDDVVAHSTASGGGIESDVPDEQREAYQQDSRECWDVWEPRVVAVTDESARRYVDDLFAAGECLELAGYTVPAPPSREAALEQVLSGGATTWDVYGHVMDEVPSRADYDDVIAECPMPGVHE